MIELLKQVLNGSLERLKQQVTVYLPALLAALTLVLAAYLSAVLVRWVIYRIFKGMAIDKFLRRTGIAFMVDSSGRLRATRLVGETVYWCILLSGLLAGVNVFGTELTTRIIDGLVLLLPKLALAGVILLAGAWLGRYLGRSMLVWAVNEGLPSPRRLGAVVRILIMFVAVVVAADQLDFASSVFLSAFIIFVGGAVLAASIAIGFGHGGLRWLLEEKREQTSESDRQSLGRHL